MKTILELTKFMKISFKYQLVHAVAGRTLQEGRLKQIQQSILQNILIHTSSRYCLLSKLDTVSKELELHSEIIRNGYAKPRKDKKDKEKCDFPRKSCRKSDRSRLISFRHALPGLARTASIRKTETTHTKRLSSGSVLSDRHISIKPNGEQNKSADENELNPFIKISQNLRKTSFRMKVCDETADTRKRLNARHSTDTITDDRRSSVTSYDSKEVQQIN